MVEVKSKTPVKYTFEPVVLTGKLAILKDDPTGVFYRLTDALPPPSSLAPLKSGSGGDGQVTLGNVVMKGDARKVRRLYQVKILAGFAGGTADAFTLFERFEAKLDKHQGNLMRSAVELAKDWRTDRMLRRLEAMLAVADKELLADHHRQRRRASSPSTACSRSARAALRAGRGARAAREHRISSPRDRREGAGDRRRHLHLHEQQHRTSIESLE